MQIKEFCEKINRSENTILRNWKRTKDALEKQGIIITRVGTGKKADYFIEYKPK